MTITSCPNCYSPSVKVVRPYRVINEAAIVRRRECKKCTHRWYTTQAIAIEHEIPGYALRWHKHHPIHGHSVEQLPQHS